MKAKSENLKSEMPIKKPAVVPIFKNPDFFHISKFGQKETKPMTKFTNSRSIIPPLQFHTQHKGGS